MNRIPKDVESLLEIFSTEFTGSVWRRFRYLLFAAIVVRGRRTVWRLLQCCGACTAGHFSSYHRVFSHRCWSGRALSRRLAEAVVSRLARDGVLQLVGDDTVSQHRGESVYGKGCHRDAVRSSHSHLVHRWGHKWIVLALRVRIPGTRRTWALPVLVTLYRTPEESKRLGIRHQTPPELMQGLLCLWLRWFPKRIVVFSADGGFATHKLSRFAARYRNRFALVSKFVPGAVLHERPAARKKGQRGRTRIVGKRLPSPEQAVAQTSKRSRHKVNWYGGGFRQVEVVTGVGHWYRQGQGLVKIRWVYVHDLSGNHRDEYLYSTQSSMTAKQIIEAFVGRWAIEVTFEEMREHLGLETTRGRSRNTVLRVEPCLFLLYTLIAFWYVQLASTKQTAILYRWPGKTSVSFTDAIAAVRRNAWEAHLFQQPRLVRHFDKLPHDAKRLVLDALSLAA